MAIPQVSSNTKDETNQRFSVITADPPWKYSDKSANRGGAERHYPTIKLGDLKLINVADYAADDSLLLMWVTAPQMKAGIELLESWGFTYKTFGFTWVKRSKRYWDNMAKEARKSIYNYYRSETEPKSVKSKFTRSALSSAFNTQWLRDTMENKWNIGMGAYTRANPEFVLIGVKGRAAALIENNGVPSVIESPIGDHSAKPELFYDYVERLVGSGPKFELFSRTNRSGWTVLGNECLTDFLLDENYQLVDCRKATKEQLPKSVVDQLNRIDGYWQKRELAAMSF